MTLRKGMTFLYRGIDTLYTITEVNRAENTIRLSWYEGKDKIIWDYNRAVKNLGDGTWILQSYEFPEKWSVWIDDVNNKDFLAYLMMKYGTVDRYLHNMSGVWLSNGNYFSPPSYLSCKSVGKKEETETITFEEFLKIVEKMKKEIKEYRVVKAFPGYKVGDVLTVAVVAALGAEDDIEHLLPVLKEDVPVFKVGDVVKCIDVKTDFPIIGEVLCNNGNASWRIKASMRVGELLTVENVGSRGVSFKNKPYNHASQAFVLATKEEIDACNNVTFNGYTSEYKPGHVNFGCQTFTEDEVNTLLKVVGSPINGTINIAGVNVTREVLEKILKNI